MESRFLIVGSILGVLAGVIMLIAASPLEWLAASVRPYAILVFPLTFGGVWFYVKGLSGHSVLALIAALLALVGLIIIRVGWWPF